MVVKYVISDDPQCRCGVIEDTQNYFSLHCIPGASRHTLNVCVTKQNPSLNLLLLGSSTFSLATNIARFEQVHTYILDVHVTNLTIHIYL